VFVGVQLCPSRAEFMKMAWAERIALASMPVVTIMTFAIDKAMLTGFVLYLVFNAVAGKKTNIYLAASAVILAIGVLLQIFA
jgi:adenine/guanine/hypoxanthine permease